MSFCCGRFKEPVIYPGVSNDGKPFKIVLVGDSLINRPFTEHKLAQRIQAHFPDVKLEFVNSGCNGNHIHHILARVQKDVLDHKPDAVILYWDSDVCEEMEVVMKEENQKKFGDTVRETINMIKSQIPLMALAGPCLLGEPGPLFAMKRYKGKDKPLDIYREINRKLCEELSVSYIDIRDAYQKAIPSWWPLQRWYLTADGEHPNDRGTQIEADLFAAVIRDWLTKTN